MCVKGECMCVKGEYMYVRGECVCEQARINYVLYGPSYKHLGQPSCLTIQYIQFLFLLLFHRYAEYETTRNICTNSTQTAIFFILLRSDSANKIAIIR